MGQSMPDADRRYPAHPANAPGPFYVANNWCISCGAPEAEAPDLMGHDEGRYSQCFFRRQPETAEELDRAILAVQVSCCGGVRYAGRDEDILRRLTKTRFPNLDQCNTLISPSSNPESPPIAPPSLIANRVRAMDHPLWDSHLDL